MNCYNHMNWIFRRQDFTRLQGDNLQLDQGHMKNAQSSPNPNPNPNIESEANRTQVNALILLPNSSNIFALEGVFPVEPGACSGGHHHHHCCKK